MRREELKELHYIAHIDNIRSILSLGILSNREASMVRHTSVAMQSVQDRRAQITVPGGRKLHEYVNLYVCARNSMLYKRKEQHLDLCILQVSPAVLDLPGVVIADANASSEYVRFAEAPGGLIIIKGELTFADDWRDTDPIQYYKKKSAKCAEVLIPGRVEPRAILGAYASCHEALDRLADMRMNISVTINGHLFFR